MFNYSNTDCGIFIRLFQFTLAFNPFGNCFSPAICIHWWGFRERYQSRVFEGLWCYPAVLQIKFRSSSGRETSVYWRGWFRFDWNSGHLARRFGKRIEAEFGDYFQWRSHNDI